VSPVDPRDDSYYPNAPKPGFSPDEEMADFLRQYDQVTGYNPNPPSPIPPPGLRIGPLRLSGNGLDSASLAVLQALQGARPQGFGQNFATGLVGGYAGARYNRALERGQANEGAQKAHADETKERARAAASYLATHRQEMARAAREAAKPQAAGGKRYPLTDTLRKQLKDNGIFVADEATDVPESAVIRDMPREQPTDPSLIMARQDLHDRRLAEEEAKRQAAEAQKADEEQYATDVADLKPSTSPVIAANRKPEDARRITNLVNKKLRENKAPYTHQQLLTLWGEKERFYKTMDQQQMVGFRQAATVANQHLKQFEDFYNAYGKIKPPAGFRTLGKGTYQLAMEGALGPQAQAAAAGLEPIKDALPTEIAKVLAGGRVPYEFEVRKAQHSFIDPFLPKRASANQLESTRRILRARIETQLTALPFAGGKGNPYLLDVSPIEGWDEVDKQAAPAAKPSNPGGKAAKYGS